MHYLGDRVMIHVPLELRNVLRASQDHPLRLSDPETDAEYVVLSADFYDQMRSHFYDDAPLTASEKQALLVQAGLRAGWDDAEMDVYADLDPRGPQE
jgi:hypothetical protein